MNPVYRFFYLIASSLAHLVYSHRVVHPEKLVEDGPAIIASNHVSFFDPPMVGIGFRNSIHYLARKTLMKGRFLEWLYLSLNSVPVDQERPDMTSLKTILRLLKEGERVLIFPEGARSWDGQLQSGEPGVGLLVAKSRAPVIPVRLFGTYEALARGDSFPHRSDVTLVVGDPVEFPVEDLEGRDKKAYQRISDRIMAAIAELELPAE